MKRAPQHEPLTNVFPAGEPQGAMCGCSRCHWITSFRSLRRLLCLLSPWASTVTVENPRQHVAWNATERLVLLTRLAEKDPPVG